MGVLFMGKIYEIALDPRAAKKIEKYRKNFRFFYHPFRKVWYATERATALARDKGFSFLIANEFDASKAGVKIIDSFPASLTTPPPEAAREELIACALAGEENGIVPSPLYLGRDIEMSIHPGAFILDRAGGRRKYAWRFPMINEDISELSIVDRFPLLLQKIKDPDTKFALSLGGGGLKAYAHTVVMRLIDALGVKGDIDEMWGTSAGAIGALWYASNVSTEEMDQSGYDVYNKRYKLKLSPSALQVLRNLFIEFLLPPSLRGSGFAGFLDVTKSLYDYILNVKKFRQPTTPFFCLAFNVNDFKPEILTPIRFDIPEYRDMIYTVDPIEAAVASSSVPMLFVPKVIKRDQKDVTYIDGMTTEAVPLMSIYQKWKIDRKIGLEKRSKLFILAAKVAKNTIYEIKVDKHVGEMAIMMMYHDAMLNATIESQRSILSEDPDVEVLELSVPLSEWSNFDIYHIPTFIKMSYVYYINDLLHYERDTTRLAMET